MENVRANNAIVLADDSLAQRMILSDYLLSKGYESVLLEDGKEVLDYLKRFTPRMLILDVDMPFIDGLGIADRIKRIPRLKNVPVLMVTAYDDTNTKESVKWVKADAILHKPVDKEIFLAKVGELLAKYDNEAELSL